MFRSLARCENTEKRDFEKGRVGNSIIGFLIKSIDFVIERFKDRFNPEKDQIATVNLF